MQLGTLQDLIVQMRKLNRLEAMRYYCGFRSYSYSYLDLYWAIAGVGEFLEQLDLCSGDKIVLWGENSPAWIILFWAAVSKSVQVVPLDSKDSERFVRDVLKRTQAKYLFYGKIVDPQSIPVPKYSLEFLHKIPGKSECSFVSANSQTPVEIVFTSGTTGKPKGLVHTHENICFDLRPFISEFDRYRKYLYWFRPLRLLNMLPYSHMFGQSLGLFIPVLLGASTVICSEINPKSLLQLIKREKVTVLVTVPGHLNRVCRYLEYKFVCSERFLNWSGFWGLLEKIWKFRDVHASLGWWFWVAVIGGANLPRELESWWRRMGFLSVQGYGLTEASPIVSLNHPFDSKSGSLGKVLPGQEVKLAPDGEILLQGENLVSEYFEDKSVDYQNYCLGEDNWFHTGDIGSLDSDGRLYFLGRKKDCIVTSQGFNVFPEDVESALKRCSDIRDCAVVGMKSGGQEEVHAVFLDPAEESPQEILQKANRELESHQQISSWSFWPFADFPRTSTTGKIKRFEIRESLEETCYPVQESNHSQRPVAEQRFSRDRNFLLKMLSSTAGISEDKITEHSKLNEDLGLSSLEKIELLSRLEEEYDIEGDEQTFLSIQTVGQLREWISGSGEAVCLEVVDFEGRNLRPQSSSKSSKQKVDSDVDLRPARSLKLPYWSRTRPVYWLRSILQDCLLIPFFKLYLNIQVRGLHNLNRVEPPVLFAANHNSHLDVPTILCALPDKYRRSLAPSIAQEHFSPLLYPASYASIKRWGYRLQYWAICMLFNAYPLPQRTPGTRDALHYAGELADSGYSTLIFPEGIRSPDVKVQPFHFGVGLLAKKLGLPIVPIRLNGLFDIFSVYHKFPRPGRVEVEFLQPLQATAEKDYSSLTQLVEQSIKYEKVGSRE